MIDQHRLWNKGLTTRSFVLLLAYSLMIMFIALYNGFPLVESDTGAYISLAFDLHNPPDRTPFYGVFIGITSLHSVVWLTILVQSAIVIYLLRRYIKLLYPEVDVFSEAFCIISICCFTCVSWITSYLMPDVFGAILLLCVVLILFDANASKKQRLLYFLLLLVAVVIHNSHFLILAAFSFLYLLYALITRKRQMVLRTIAMLCISIFFWFGMCCLNYYKGHGFTYSRASHVFMVTKFAESGILATYLHDNCGKKNLKICAYQDKIPAYSWDFLWGSESPLYKTGGWDSNRVEYNAIIHDVFTTPKYITLFIQTAIVSTCKELIQIQAPEHTISFGKDSSPYSNLHAYYSDEINEFITSRQNTEGFGAAGLMNTIYYLFFVLSTLWLLFFNKSVMEQKLCWIYIAILIFFIINAFVTSVFSTVIYRFQNRVFWILPATNAIIIARYYFNKYAKIA